LLRPALPIATAAAVLVLIPSTASATTEPAPVENLFSAGYYASTEVVLPDGRKATASLGEHREANQDGWVGDLYLSAWNERDCGFWMCQDDRVSGSVVLTDDQVDFDRSLRTASVQDITVILSGQSYGGPSLPGWPVPEPVPSTTVTVSLLFTGTGEVTRSRYQGDMCGDGMRECQSMRIEASREGVGTLTVDGEDVSGAAYLSYVQGVDAAAPTFEEGPDN
jgi:hypothetical protein